MGVLSAEIKLNKDEINLLSLYKCLSDKDREEIKGIIHLKLDIGYPEKRKPISSDSGHGEEAATNDDPLTKMA